MSRSYKKTPYCGDNKRNKNRASRRVRNRVLNDDTLPQRCMYRKFFEQYDICDYYSIFFSFEDFLKSARKNSYFDNWSDERMLQFYLGQYRRK